MIDHIYLPVSDLKRSSEFYKKMLEPLGIDHWAVRQFPLDMFRRVNTSPVLFAQPLELKDR